MIWATSGVAFAVWVTELGIALGSACQLPFPLLVPGAVQQVGLSGSLRFCAAEPVPPRNVTQAASLGADLCFCDYWVSLQKVAA